MKYRDDCERIQTLLSQHGLMLTLQESESLWDEVSDSFAAGWMGLPLNDDDLLSMIKRAAIEVAKGKTSVERELTLSRLANEFRETMDNDILRSWARDVVAAIKGGS
jgi:hypothetical protein